MFELSAATEPGARLVALAEELALAIAPAAVAHDRGATFPFESFAAVKASGFLLGPIPAELGGLGVTSVHDVVVAASRLARGDASLAIGVNMHFVFLLNLVRRREAAAVAETLAGIARDGSVFAAAISEAAQDLTRPGTTAARTETGWRVAGRKIFCTMSPAADVLYTAVTFAGDDGRERYGYAMIPRETPGVVVHDDWDALGMRASGSNSVTFDEVDLPPSALVGGFPVGDTAAYMERNLNAGLLHAAATLGVAESANNIARERLAGRDGHRAGLLAENTVELAACRGVVARAAGLIDRHRAANPSSAGTDDEVLELFVEAQAAKAFVSRTAPRVVDRALALSGGAGYMNGSPLARAYRDVRAGAFMHPLGDNRAYELIEQVALGREPALH
jgi:L-evernosamine nitrososynthase